MLAFRLFVFRADHTSRAQALDIKISFQIPSLMQVFRFGHQRNFNSGLTRKHLIIADNSSVTCADTRTFRQGFGSEAFS